MCGICVSYVWGMHVVGGLCVPYVYAEELKYWDKV